MFDVAEEHTSQVSGQFRLTVGTIQLHFFFLAQMQSFVPEIKPISKFSISSRHGKFPWSSLLSWWFKRPNGDVSIAYTICVVAMKIITKRGRIIEQRLIVMIGESKGELWKSKVSMKEKRNVTQLIAENVSLFFSESP